ANHGQEGDSPLAARLDAPGIRNVLPGGTPLLDVVVDPPVFIKAYAADNEEVVRGLRDVGADAVGPLAWRQSFDRGCYQSTLAVSLPAPRRGLLRILEQDCDPSEVPAFVSREAVDLTQISLDLGKAYQTLKEFAVAQGGEEAGNLFTAAEMQAQGWIGVDLPGVLGGLGSRHWFISYPPRVAEALEESRRGPGWSLHRDREPCGKRRICRSIVRRAGELLPLKPARMFGVSDCSRSGGTLGMLRDLAAALTPEDVGDDYRDLLADLQAILPSGADMEGMMGTGAMLMTVDDDGVALRSVWEMPAP
ncbi:MAG: hypothetical protein EBR23_08020, partial [Planctomycetia bacterium]|nr:hypothetical protein [Planctomycetia bacterium]